jgi:hypothetical protein
LELAESYRNLAQMKRLVLRKVIGYAQLGRPMMPDLHRG